MPSKLVMMSWNDDSPLGPSNALPTPPMYPSGGFPVAPGYPSGGFPVAPGHPSGGFPIAPGLPITLPVFPYDPTLEPTPPIAGTTPPPPTTKPIEPGARFIVKWLACVGLILVPDNTLPPTATPK
jgi:hypothetical protein